MAVRLTSWLLKGIFCSGQTIRSAKSSLRHPPKFFTGFRIVRGGRLHLDGVVAVPELGQAEAADLLERVDAGEKPVVVSFGAKSQHRAPEQVELQSTNQAVIIRLVVMLGLARLGAIQEDF